MITVIHTLFYARTKTINLRKDLKRFVVKFKKQLKFNWVRAITIKAIHLLGLMATFLINDLMQYFLNFNRFKQTSRHQDLIQVGGVNDRIFVTYNS